jgi:hypothetical protein
MGNYKRYETPPGSTTAPTKTSASARDLKLTIKQHRFIGGKLKRYSTILRRKRRGYSKPNRCRWCARKRMPTECCSATRSCPMTSPLRSIIRRSSVMDQTPLSKRTWSFGHKHRTFSATSGPSWAIVRVESKRLHCS